MTSGPGTLAFDFDGVLCNGLREYFATAWQVYGQIWSAQTPPAQLDLTFHRLRPVVEVGWEMPVVLRAALQGVPEAQILDQWPQVRDAIVQADRLDPAAIAQQVDQQRDRWIQQDLDSWLHLHDFYPGVVTQLKQLQQSGLPFVIVTTKESRFVRQLLKQADIQLEDAQIFGKDRKRPKPETLRQLRKALPQPIWFLEDRIAALEAVKAEADLQDISLFLADWGYNLPRDRQRAQQTPGLHCLSLEQFSQPFSTWRSP